MCQKFILYFGPIQEYASGDLAVEEVNAFGRAPGEIDVFSSTEEAISTWMRAMSSQSIDLTELPRRRGFGLIYSVHRSGQIENGLIAVMVEEVTATATA